MKYFIIALLIILLGCTSEIELNLEDYTPKIAVDGWIELDEPASIYLTFSSPFLSQYDSVSVVKSFINHAKITIYSSTGEEEILTLFKKNSFFPPFVYKTTELVGVAGNTYLLKIEYNGKIITASTTIPEPPIVQSISFNKVSEYKGTLIVKYIPNDSNSSYYLFQTAQKSYDFKLRPTYYPLKINNSGKRELMVQELLKGRENNISDISIRTTEVDDTIGARYYWNKDIVLVAVSSIDVQSFEVLNSIFFTLSNYDNPFTVSNPATTNINGGIGRWTGLGTTKVLFNNSSKDSTYFE
jgi:hypothetical protein